MRSRPSLAPKCSWVEGELKGSRRVEGEGGRPWRPAGGAPVAAAAPGSRGREAGEG
jgi:hypothetical protein